MKTEDPPLCLDTLNEEREGERNKGSVCLTESEASASLDPFV